jgi:hypothetical protein
MSKNTQKRICIHIFYLIYSKTAQVALFTAGQHSLACLIELVHTGCNLLLLRAQPSSILVIMHWYSGSNILILNCTTNLHCMSTFTVLIYLYPGIYPELISYTVICSPAIGRQSTRTVVPDSFQLTCEQLHRWIALEIFKILRVILVGILFYRVLDDHCASSDNSAGVRSLRIEVSQGHYVFSKVILYYQTCRLLRCRVLYIWSNYNIYRRTTSTWTIKWGIIYISSANINNSSIMQRQSSKKNQQIGRIYFSVFSIFCCCNVQERLWNIEWFCTLGSCWPKHVPQAAIIIMAQKATTLLPSLYLGL